MASLGQICRVAKIFCEKLPFRSNVIRFRLQRFKKTSSVLLSSGIVGVASKKETILEVPDGSKLSTEYLIKSSGIVAVEQANNLIAYIASGLDKAEKQYAEAVFALVVLMEYKLQVLGHKQEEERIWELILEGRALVGKVRQKKQDLEMMMMSAVNMLNSAAEIAYMAGEEFSGSCAGDRLNKVEAFIKQSKLESEKAEQRLREIEAKTVEIETKHAEEQNRKKEKEKENKEKEGQSAGEKNQESNNAETVINICDNGVGDVKDKNEELIT